MKTISILFLISSLILLVSCTDIAVTGAQAFYGRRNIEKHFNDQYTTLQVYKTLHRKTDDFKNANIVIATYHGEVLLAGQVPETWQKAKAYQLTARISNIKKIYNFLDVASPSSNVIRLSDAWITTKIKSLYILSNELDASEIKVVTENGTVYLMGILPPDEAKVAVRIARTTDGVQKVVKIFSYLHVTKSTMLPSADITKS